MDRTCAGRKDMRRFRFELLLFSERDATSDVLRFFERRHALEYYFYFIDWEYLTFSTGGRQGYLTVVKTEDRFIESINYSQASIEFIALLSNKIFAFSFFFCLLLA
jgi:hypothetical protein